MEFPKKETIKVYLCHDTTKTIILKVLRHNNMDKYMEVYYPKKVRGIVINTYTDLANIALKCGLPIPIDKIKKIRVVGFSIIGKWK